MLDTISLQTSSLIAPSALTLNLVLTSVILAPVRWWESWPAAWCSVHDCGPAQLNVGRGPVRPPSTYVPRA
jgi:hypothetical protein